MVNDKRKKESNSKDDDDDSSYMDYACCTIDYDHLKKYKRIIIEYNNIKAKDFLRGADETEAFKNKEYIKLHRSTLRKVDVLANLLNRAIDKKLKVKSRWYEIHGLSPQGVFDYFTSRWWFRLIWTIISMVLGAIIGHFI